MHPAAEAGWPRAATSKAPNTWVRAGTRAATAAALQGQIRKRDRYDRTLWPWLTCSRAGDAGSLTLRPRPGTSTSPSSNHVPTARCTLRQRPYPRPGWRIGRPAPVATCLPAAPPRTIPCPPRHRARRWAAVAAPHHAPTKPLCSITICKHPQPFGREGGGRAPVQRHYCSD